eukprot:2487743-Ditylum_brightwellii.AAC.1
MKGWLPLHILVSKKEKSFKVNYVLDTYPEGMDVKTSGGSSPRDLAKGMRMKLRVRRNSRSFDARSIPQDLAKGKRLSFTIRRNSRTSQQ